MTEVCRVPLGSGSCLVFNQLTNSLHGLCFRWSLAKSRPFPWPAVSLSLFCALMILNQPFKLLPFCAFPSSPVCWPRVGRKTCLPLKELRQGRRKIKGWSWYTIQKLTGGKTELFLGGQIKHQRRKLKWVGLQRGPTQQTGHRAQNTLRGGSGGTTSVFWQLLSSQRQKEELVHMGGGQQRAGKAPNPNKLISANVMFIKSLR